MKKIINDYKGVAIFYLIIILTIVLVSFQNTNSDFNPNSTNSNIINIKK